MIRFVTSDMAPLLLDFCAKFGIFGTKIYSQYQTYGTESGVVDFWLVLEDALPVGAVSRLGSALTVTGTADPEELAEFLSAVGGVSVELEAPLAEQTNHFLDAPFTTSWILCGERREQSDCPEYPAEIGPAEDLRTVYNLLCRAQAGFAQAVRYEAWLTEISHKVRHHLAEIYLLKVDDLIISTSSILFQDETRAVLAFVATDPDFSGRGCGRQMVCYTAGRALEQGRTPYVLIEKDELRPFYERCGFIPCGRWARLVLRGAGKE